MNVIDALCSRHSVRAFKPDPVTKEMISKIIGAAAYAPSWRNSQPWEVFIASGQPLERLRAGFIRRFDEDAPANTDLPKPQNFPPHQEQRMFENGAQRSAVMGIERNDTQGRRRLMRNGYALFGAPLAVFLCIHRDLGPWSMFDLGMFAQSIMAAAREFGLDSVPAICMVDYPDLIRAELGIPDDLAVVLAIALGHAVQDHPINLYRSTKRSVDDIARSKGL